MSRGGSRLCALSSGAPPNTSRTLRIVERRAVERVDHCAIPRNDQKKVYLNTLCVVERRAVVERFAVERCTVAHCVPSNAVPSNAVPSNAVPLNAYVC